MIKKSGLINQITISVVTLSLLTFVFSGYAYSQSIFEIEAILSPPPPVFVNEGDHISATVDFGHNFTSIERICFIFFFVDDLLDPGDHLVFGPFIRGSGFGFTNGSPSAMSSRTICIIGGGHPEVMLFLDGQQNFNIVMEQGSVILSSLKVQVTGKSIKLVDIDIKPGGESNSINCNNDNEVIPVAILTTDDFDATTVDHTTVSFEGASEIHTDPRSGEPRRHEEDVDGDGDIDLVFHFRLGDTALTCDSTEGTLTGETFDGQAIEGTDSVNMTDS